MTTSAPTITQAATTDRGRIRAVQVTGERKLEVTTIEGPPAPKPDEVQVRIKAVALNHIDVWGWRGMAFARRKLPIVAGAEASGEIVCSRQRRPRFETRRHRFALRRTHVRNLSGLP